MKTRMLVLMASILVLSACMVAPRPGGGLEIVPILPVVVELDTDSHYSHGGYHYFYSDDRWYYSTERNGSRSELPRSHWPRETRRGGGRH
jgi:hypothetical protein